MSYMSHGELRSFARRYVKTNDKGLEWDRDSLILQTVHPLPRKLQGAEVAILTSESEIQLERGLGIIQLNPALWEQGFVSGPTVVTPTTTLQPVKFTIDLLEGVDLQMDYFAKIYFMS